MQVGTFPIGLGMTSGRPLRSWSASPITPSSANGQLRHPGHHERAEELGGTVTVGDGSPGVTIKARLRAVTVATLVPGVPGGAVLVSWPGFDYPRCVTNRSVGSASGARHTGKDQGNRPGCSRVRPDGPNATVEASGNQRIGARPWP